MVVQGKKVISYSLNSTAHLVSRLESSDLCMMLLEGGEDHDMMALEVWHKFASCSDEG